MCHPLHALCLAAAVLACSARAAAEDTPPQQVVITASRWALLAADAPASMSVLRQEDLQVRGADNLLDALRGEAGVSLQGRAVGGRKVLGLRGLDSRHTLFLVDGRRIGASDGVIGASDFQYDWAAAEDIERVEVVRGPLSVLYGSEALGGVVNVITRQPGDTWRAGALLEGSSARGGRGGDGHRRALHVDGPLGDGVHVRAGAAATQVDALASPADARISELEGRSKEDGWLGLTWRGGGHRLDAEHRAGREERRADARERSGQRRYHRTVNDLQRSLSALSWQAEGGDTPMQLRAYRARLDVVNTRTAGVAVNAPQQLEDGVLEGQARRTLGAQAWTAGFEARNEALSDPGLPGGRSLARHRALYLQDEADVGPAFTLTAGLRHDDHSLYGGEWSPRAYALWRLAPGLTLKGGVSRGFKAPNLKQIVPGARTEGPNTFFGNPALRPERSHAAEAGVAWAEGAAQAQAVVFEQRVTDLIDIRLVTPGPAPGLGSYTYENLAEARLRGLEAAFTQPLGAGFTAATAYTYLDAKNGSGQRLDRRPRHAATLRLDWKRGPWRAGLHADWNRGQTLPAATTGAPSQPVPDLTLVGAHAAWALPAGLEASIGVANLTNRRLADLSPLFTQVEPPRTWRFALRGRW